MSRKEAVGDLRSAAAILRKEKSSILDQFDREARQELLAARSQTRSALIDSLPRFLDELAHSLEDSHPRLAGLHEFAWRHGEERTHLPAFDLDQIHNEFNLIRRIVFRVLDQQISLTSRERDTIIEYIQRAKQSSANTFVQLSERREREIIQALRSSEEMHRQTFEQAAVGMAHASLDGRWLRVNPRFCEIVGYSREELLTMDFQRLTYPPDLHADLHFMRQLLTGSISYFRHEKRYVKRSGEAFWVDLSVSLAREPEGRPLYFIAAIEDITRRKAMEASHRESNLKAKEALDALNSFIDASPLGVAIVDDAGRYLRINSVLAQLNGLSADEHAGKSLFEILPKKLAEKSYAYVNEIVKTGVSKKDIEIVRTDSITGEQRTFIANYFPLFREGKVWAVGIKSLEITDRKKLEEEKDLANRRLKELQRITEAALHQTRTLDELLKTCLGYVAEFFRSDSAVILLLDESGNYLEARAAIGFADQAGQPVKVQKNDGIAGQVLRKGQAIRIDDLKNSGVSSPILLRSGLCCLISAPLRTKERIHGVIHVGRIGDEAFDDDDLAFLQVVADRMSTAIESSQLYSRLQSSIQELSVEQELREQFVSSLTHDLRNPLAAAKISAQIIQGRPTQPDRVLTLAKRVIESLSRVDQMIQDLLDTNRIRAGQGLSIHPIECELTEVIRKVCDDMNLVHGDRIVMHFDRDSIRGYWDGGELRRALENLVTNAIKYGDPEKEVLISVSTQSPKAISISVHNEGRPIPKEEQLRLFKRFERGSQTRGVKGWGIGLTLVRGVTDAHHGTVELDSSEQKGTTFTMRLPWDSRSPKQ